ncbi:MAG: bifunctional precorrin-2 dehydrogenase/sirohydrochlorin ferrochelatase [Pseudomonadota bacterium]
MAELASLPLFHQITGKPVLVLGDGEAAEPKRRLVVRAGGVLVDNQAEALQKGARIAFVAYDDADQCAAAAAELRKAGLLVNVVDRPDLCDFTTPSVLDRNPLLIAVGTGGASAGLAKHVRLRLERILPETLGKLAMALKAARPSLRKRFPDGGDRRRAIDTALREGGALDPFDGRSYERAQDWARGDIEDMDNATHVFEYSSTDPEDLTLRQARLLGEADVVCAQGELPPAILARARADAARVVCEKADCPLRAINAGNPSETPCPKAQAMGLDGGLTVILRARHGA